MIILNECSRTKMEMEQKKDANAKFTVCNPEKCPRCRCSDG